MLRISLKHTPPVSCALAVMVLALLTPFSQAAGFRWNPAQRTLELLEPGKKPWLSGGAARVVPVDGSVISTNDPRFKVTVSEHHGCVVIAGVDQQKALDWEIVLREPDDASARIDWTIMNRGAKPLKLKRLDVLTGRLTGKVDSENNRVLTNGHNSWRGEDVGRLVAGKPVTSYYTLACQRPPLAAGFLAGRHNLDQFTLERTDGGVQLTAYGECGGCVLPAGATRRADPLFISGDANPLHQMERFADLAAEENGVQLWPENFATWCSWYAGWIRQEPLYEYKDGLQEGVEANIPLVKGHLGTRGTPSMRVVDDSNEMAYGDWDNRTLAVPGGFERLATMMNQRGIRAGIWYPPFWVSSKSRLFREHKGYLCKEDDGEIHVGEMYGNGIAVLDASNPAAAESMGRTARAWRDRGFRYVMTDFLIWGARKQTQHDPTMTPVEAYCRGVEAMRRGFGKDTYWLHCGALLGPAMGLCDGMRISGDSHGGAFYSYSSAGTRWFYNWRTWVNDPDAIVCIRRGERKTVDWNRTWMSWMALAGAVLTYGDTLDDLPDEYIKIYQRVLPPLAVPGRPLDLWENQPYMVWGMAPGEADGPYSLFGVFEFQGRHGDQKMAINLDEVAARSRSWRNKPAEAPAAWLLWDFWKQKLYTVDGASLTIDVPMKSCSVFSLRPMTGRPQLLGTSGHFSQGVLETGDIRWDDRHHRLTGKARGNGGDPTTLFFYVPEGMQCTFASVDYEPAEPKSGEPRVVAVPVPKTGTEMVPFELRFTGKAAKPESRAFVPGPVARILSEPE